MKKSAAMILAAAMILSMAGCSDSAKGTAGKDISVVSQKEPSSSVSDKLTPPMTIAQEFAKGKYDDYRYFSTAEEYDSKAKVNRSYKGEITADEFRREIFETLCRIIGNGEMTLKDGQRATQSGYTLTSDNLTVFTSIQGHHWAFDFSDVTLRIIVDEPLNPRTLFDLRHLA